MDVMLYVYDLSNGLARTLSLQITGTQIDAIYHTSLVFGGVEYYFGRGIQQAAPGTTHHGQPIETLLLGRSELPIEVIIEYMDSLARTYTEDSYDLFLRNCNNFTHDLAMFLVGKGIPEHIRNLPETFLNSPFGQMMKPYIDNMFQERAQGPPAQSSQTVPPSAFKTDYGGRVHNVTTIKEVEELLSQAQKSCAVIFFTSSTCPPCKTVYPVYDLLAEEAGEKAILIKVDINYAYDVSSKYNIRATPTFMAFLKGQKDNEWSGADEVQLRSNVRMLIQMAWPSHPHSDLRLPSLQRMIDSYVCYRKIPPLDKLVQKIGPAGNEPILTDLVTFIREENGPSSAKPPIPDLASLAVFIQTRFPQLPPEIHFAVIDLVRTAFIDSRVSGFYAEEKDHKTLLTLLAGAKEPSNCSYGHQLVMTQLMCNLFSTQLYPDQILSHNVLRDTCISFVTTSLLDSHGNLRVAAASFIYNLAALNHNERLQDHPDKLAEAIQVELVASLLEAIQNESESLDNLRGLLLSLGLLVYCAPMDGEVLDLCRVTEAKKTVLEKLKIESFSSEKLIKEIGEELLGKGLA
ncbi:hypothetical protein PRK78_006515 [Emydomyces testavorans]|uniref:Thioredoxin n=1 Tax=Emydomyces testavorans TaxID=2070801 RepID=A0AAF0DPA3_9EURO|nr:hypothetical protein PRK78_006515 [Emydomyces testavorans]